MKFGYTIIYVGDVEATLHFYQQAFGFEIRFLHESKEYGELATGETTLAFASFAMGEMNLAGKYQQVNLNQDPFGIEIAFVTEDIDAAYAKAVQAGAYVVTSPELKPWGQMVGYLRGPEGTLIELCTPVGA
ncbi:VOC family protein [Parvibium lacunae]|uniref:VOC family protein n=1 Tax=Parvibium lacunae TaxID=1888893 RepID=A0A368KYF8_9BURK|nr:VOC family protein [Parvibium lacunae]RCS56477.1 VOC family protein [Parvibium lacunae]